MNIGKSLPLIVLVGCLALLFSACGSKNGAKNGANPADSNNQGEQKEMRVFDNGVVTDIDEQGRNLLVTQVTDSGGNSAVRAVRFAVTEKTALTDSQGNELAFDRIRVGDRVEAWHTGPLRESFPEQGEASKIVLLPEPDAPDGWVSRQAAVKAALASLTAGNVWGVRESVADREGEQWRVRLVAAGDPNPREVSVDAKSGNIIYSQNDAFRVFAPMPSDTVGSSFTVRGKARVFEAAFLWELEDGHNILAKGNEMADAGAPEWGTFEFTVKYEAASNPTLSLFLYVGSPKDGSREHELVVPLKPEKNLIRLSASAVQSPPDEREYKGYQKIETADFSVFIPEDWTAKALPGNEYEFWNGEKKVGNTVTIAYFDENTWPNYRPNHSEQTDFRELKQVLPTEGDGIKVYQANLILTKPAAEQDPDWQYHETEVYVTVKERQRSYGLLFGTEDVPEEQIMKIVKSFRLKEAQVS